MSDQVTAWAMRDAAGKVRRIVHCVEEQLPGCTPAGFTVEPLTDQALDHDPEPLDLEIRSRRDFLLKSSDWTQIPDTPLSDVARGAWAVYRKALRAVPQQPGFPASVVWPQAPDVSVG